MKLFQKIPVLTDTQKISPLPAEKDREMFCNPDRGLRHEITFHLNNVFPYEVPAEIDSYREVIQRHVDYFEFADPALAQVYIYLTDFHARKDLPETVFTRIRAIFQILREHKLKALGGIKVAGGLVGNYGKGIIYQRSCDGNSLLLAAGKLTGQALFSSLKANKLQHIGDALGYLLLGGAHNVHCESHVFVDILVLDETEVLEDDAQSASQFGQMSALHFGELHAVDTDGTFNGDYLTGQHFYNGGLAAAGGAHQEGEFTVTYGEADIVYRAGLAMVIDHADVLKFDHRFPPVAGEVKLNILRPEN